MSRITDDFFESVSLSYKDAFEMMMKSTSDSIYFKDCQSRFLYVSNAQLRRLNEKDMLAVIGKSDFDFFSKEHATKSFQEEQEIIRTGTPIINEEEHSAFANGELLWSKVSRYPLYDHNRNIVGTWGISTDITNQKKAELETKEREARFHLLAEITIEGIVIHDGGIIKDVNPSLSVMLGYEQSELFGRNITDFICPEDRATVAESMAKDSDRLLEISLMKKDGTKFLAEVEGKSMGVVGTKLRMAAVRDITKRKLTEAALKDRELQMRSITDSAYDAILMLDPTGNISYWNLAALRIFGYTSEEAIGKNPKDLLMPRFHNDAPLAEFPKPHIGKKGSVLGETFELDMVRRDQTIVPVQLSLSAVEMSNGWHSIGILRDISQQKKNEEELINAKTVAEEATHAKSEFLANMSHEIRTPMNAVIGFSELLKKTDMTLKQRDYISKIDASAKSLLGIINDILDFSKMEAGRLELERVDFRLDDVINNVISMNSNKASEKNIELINNIEIDVPYCLIGDPLRVGQVLLNLVNNAVKFTSEGHVLVQVSLVSRIDQACRVKFSVSDTGIGLTKEQKEKLFSAFSQADTSVTRRFGGTGLGLTISKRLVEMMNGAISVESEFGVGSTFSFEIEFRIQSGDKAEQPGHKKNLKNLKVLIVDDNKVSREILQEQIGAFGVDAVTVASGREAIEEVKNQSEQKPFDLVIMDWRMPGMDGIEAAETILNDKTNSRTPMAIMVSAFGREEVAKKAEKIGIRNFLMKPINQSLLFDTIVNMFDMDKSGMTIQSGTEAVDETKDIRIDGARILLVEDNAINQEVATEILSSAGAIVEVANNGKEAIDAIVAQTYDLVLMDLQMPVMGGYEATKRIRADRKNLDLPIIAMTAHAMQGVEAECKAAGMNDYVSKPIDPHNLFATILKWMKPKTGASRIVSTRSDGSNKEVAVRPKLPDMIVGVDIDEGLSRVGGNKILYWKLLNDFAENYRSFIPDIQRTIKEGKIEDTRRLAHTLKGVSGNISAKDVFSLSEQLEKALRMTPLPDCAPLLDQLDFALRSVIDVIDAAREELRETTIEQDVALPEDYETILRGAAQLIWTDDTDAGNAVLQLKKTFGRKFAAEIEEVERDVDGFDFEAAKKPIRKIAAELNIKLDGIDNE
jgi:PAS domain S-box-containing protein